jgi:trk system potassium uptake protein TrkA
MTSNQTVVDERPTECERSEYYVLGGRHLGSAVAHRLRADGHPVCIVDESYDQSETSGFRGDPTDIRTLEEAGVATASTVVVATASDSRNLLIAQLVRAYFDEITIIVLTNVPDRLELFTEAGHDPVSATSALSDAIVDAI